MSSLRRGIRQGELRQPLESPKRARVTRAVGLDRMSGGLDQSLLSSAGGSLCAIGNLQTPQDVLYVGFNRVG